MAWPIWCHRNNLIFKNMDAHPDQVINVVVKLFDDTGYYNIVSGILGKDDRTSLQVLHRNHNPMPLRWNQPPENWIKINVDTSRRECTKVATIGYVMTESRSNVILRRSKRLGDCKTLVAECVAVGEAICMAV